MTNKEILTKALRKVSDRMPNADEKAMIDSCEETNEYFRIIYNRPFAIRFFGERMLKTENAAGMQDEIPIWLFHLQQMVGSPEPLKYMEDFV